MSSRSAVLERPRPRVRVAPRAASSDAEDAAFLAAGYGLEPFDWQEDVLEDWLGRRADGRWASKTCALAVPRQNGKNALLEIRELFGMIALGERFLHTAHEVKTARKAFLRIASFFENPRQYPELAQLAAEIRKANGQEMVRLHNGGSVEFIARSPTSGRGYTVDVLVCDEAQNLSDEELAALKSTTSAAPSGNSQFILTGTPPDPEKDTQGEVFKRIRADAEARRDTRLCWIDFGADDGPLPDVDDRALWVTHNPSLGALIDIEDVIQERTVLSPEAFARERLGWWGDPAAASSTAFGEGRWGACLVDDLEQPTLSALGVAVAWDRQHASLGAAGMLGDQMLVNALERRPGVGWVIPEVKRIQDKHRCVVVVDPGGPSADLIEAMRLAGIVIVPDFKTKNLAEAASGLFDRVQARTVSHPGHPELDSAVAAAAKRDIGDGGWAWARKRSAGDISMLEAVTLAAWGVPQTYDPLKSIL